MKLSLGIFILSVSAPRANAALRGNKPWRQFKCTLSAFSDEDKCREASTHNGDPCSYCTVDDGNESAGLCVNPEVALKLEQMNPQVSCHSGAESETVISTIVEASESESEWKSAQFTCTFKAFTSPDTCFATVSEEGSSCKYCSLDGPLGTYGVCVSQEQSVQLKELASQFNCSSNREQFVSGIHSNPVKDCNLSGTDENTCLDPSQVNGSECVWCDTSIGGFCFPKDWQGAASKFMTCTTAKEKNIESILGEEIDVSVTFSSCASTLLNADDCRASIDSESNEHCVYCKSTLMEVGLCMPPFFKGKQGQYYTCDNIEHLLAVE
jgi:hypothetical protein